MNSNLLNYYYGKLHYAANQLTHKYSVPIPIDKICESLCINIKRKNINNKYIEFVKINERFFINISDKFNDVNFIDNNFIRYLIAHEVGHYLLDVEFNTSPARHEYWQHELLSDYFARALLIPQIWLEKKIINIPVEGNSISGLGRHIINHCNVTWQTSVSRIADYFFNIDFVSYKFIHQGQDRYARVNFVTFDNNQYLNRKINKDNPIHELFFKQTTTSLEKKVDSYDIQKLFSKEFHFLPCPNSIKFNILVRHNSAYLTLIHEKKEQAGEHGRKTARRFLKGQHSA